MSFKKKLKANVSLTTVLVAGAILLLSGITILYTSMDLSRITNDNMNYQLAQLRSTSCLEEALHKIKINLYYVGNVDINFSDGNCVGVISIDELDSNKRIVEIESTVNDYYFRINKIIDISSSPFSITN